MLLAVQRLTRESSEIGERASRRGGGRTRCTVFRVVRGRQQASLGLRVRRRGSAETSGRLKKGIQSFFLVFVFVSMDDDQAKE